MALYHASDNWGEAPEGTIIQVHQYVSDSAATHTSNGWNLHMQENFTPKVQTSKILIMGQAFVGTQSAEDMALQLHANNTNDNGYISGSAHTSGGRNCLAKFTNHDDFSTYDRLEACHYQFWHDHNTTSQITYGIYVSPRTDDGNKSWRRNEPWNTNSAGYNFHALSIMTFMEVSTG
nr:hypothetical protein [uncultured Mediterranean phage uvMED]BAR21531.1 hypothetical protein [uncultured Mediterranean phage uvMED]BAR38650.1 hypothetical protein [uncultured Mediterranean phage uvMED]